MPKGRYKPFSALTNRHKRKLIELEVQADDEDNEVKSELEFIIPDDQYSSGKADKATQVSGHVDNSALMEVLVSIKEEVKDLKRKFARHVLEEEETLATILKKLDAKLMGMGASAPNSVMDEESKGLYSLPIDELPLLMELESTLEENSNYRKYLINYLKDRSSCILYKCISDKQLSAGLNKTVNDMCSMIISHDLAVSFCMKGRSEQKIGFEVHFKNIIDIIFEAVKAKSVTGTCFDIISVKRSIGEWFRVSKYRTSEGKKMRRVGSLEQPRDYSPLEDVLEPTL